MATFRGGGSAKSAKVLVNNLQSDKSSQGGMPMALRERLLTKRTWKLLCAS